MKQIIPAEIHIERHHFLVVEEGASLKEIDKFRKYLNSIGMRFKCINVVNPEKTNPPSICLPEEYPTGFVPWKQINQDEKTRQYYTGVLKNQQNKFDERYNEITNEILPILEKLEGKISGLVSIIHS